MQNGYSHTCVWSVQCNTHMTRISSSWPTHHFKSLNRPVTRAATEIRVIVPYYCCASSYWECTYCWTLSCTLVCFKYNVSLRNNFKLLSEKGYSHCVLSFIVHLIKHGDKAIGCLLKMKKRTTFHKIIGKLNSILSLYFKCNFVKKNRLISICLSRETLI